MDIPIFTLYKNNNVNFDNDNNYHSVKSNSLIKKNSIILIEHCFCEKNGNLVITNLIKNHEFLFNGLYPRTMKWTNDIRSGDNDEILNLIYQKIKNNCFKNIDNDLMLGNEISYFNHSNKPNCKCYAQPFEIAGMITRIAFVVSLREIEPNEELFIEYDKNIKFENGEKYIVENNDNFENMDDGFLKTRYIKQMCKTHFSRDVFVNVVTNQKCAHIGLYISKDFIAVTSRFAKIYKELVGNTLELQMQNIEYFLHKIKNEIIKIRCAFHCNDICIFVPSHIGYDLQMEYLSKCLESLIFQNEKADIYVSISYEEKYKEKVMIFVEAFKLKGINFNIECTQKYQMEHIYLLSKIIENKYYDLIFFCDDDDTYEPTRIKQMCLSMCYAYMNMSKEKIKLLGGVREYVKDEGCLIENQIPEYWAYGIKQRLLENFFDFFKDDMELLKHIFADEYFRMYLRNNKEYSEWSGIDNTRSKPLYNYNIINPDSICGRIKKLKKSVIKYTNEIHKNNLLLYTIHCNEKRYNKYVKDNKLESKIKIIFPEREHIKSIINKMYNVTFL